MLIAGHNLLDSVTVDESALVDPALAGVRDRIRPGTWCSSPIRSFRGLASRRSDFRLGQVYGWDPARRRAFLLRLGLALSAAFIVLRWINIYGDPQRWTPQKSTLFTALSFLNTTKYPPSLLFLLMTLGPALVFLWAVDDGTPRVLGRRCVIGKVPLFYYVLHFALIHLLAVVTCLRATAFGALDVRVAGPRPLSVHGRRRAGASRCRWSIWCGRLVVVRMYPLCRWFAAVKQRRSDVWLSYL